MKFKIQCSEIGQIMVDFQMITSYLEVWIREKFFGRKKGFGGKYIDNDTTVEDAIDYLTENGFYDSAIKNEKHFENEHLIGTPNIIQSDTVDFLKINYDLFEFPLFDTEITNKAYFYQLQGHMALTGKVKGRLIYILQNPPEHIIQRGVNVDFINNLDSLNDVYATIRKEKEARKQLMFDDLEFKHRVKVFEIERDEDVINAIYARVQQCQSYINYLESKL